MNIQTFIQNLDTMDVKERENTLNILLKKHLTPISENTLLQFQNKREFTNWPEFIQKQNKVIIQCLVAEMAVTNKEARQHFKLPPLTGETEII